MDIRRLIRLTSIGIIVDRRWLHHHRCGRPPGIDAGARWVLLPLMNHTETPQATCRAETVVEAVLRTGGAATSGVIRPTSTTNPCSSRWSANAAGGRAGLGRAEARYAVTGALRSTSGATKVGVDGEPAVGVACNGRQ